MWERLHGDLCDVCESAGGVQRAQPASGSSGARTLSAPEERERFGCVQRSKKGRLGWSMLMCDEKARAVRL